MKEKKKQKKYAHKVLMPLLMSLTAILPFFICYALFNSFNTDTAGNFGNTFSAALVVLTGLNIMSLRYQNGMIYTVLIGLTFSAMCGYCFI